MAVWKDERFGGSPFADIYGTRITADGRVQDSAGMPIAPTHTQDADPHIVWNGDHYLAIFGSYLDLGVTAVKISREGAITESRALVRPRIVADTALAWNGSSYLIVWRELPQQSGVVPSIRAQLFDRELNAISGEVTVGEGLAASAGSNGDNFLISWIDNGTAMTRTVSRSGALGSSINLGSGVIGRPAVASDGTRYVIARPTSAGLSLTPLNGDGSTGSTIDIAFEVPTFPDLALVWTGSRYVISWNERRQLFSNVVVAEMDRTLALLGTPQQISADSAQTSPAIGIAGNKVLLLWSNETGEVDVRGAFVKPQTTDSFLVSSGLGPQRIIETATIGDTHAIIWFEGEGAARRLMFGRIGPAGDPLDGPGIDLGFVDSATIAASENQFLVATGYLLEISATRFRKDGQRLDATPARLGLDGVSPNVASDGHDFVVVWNRLTGGGVYSAVVKADGTKSAAIELWRGFYDERAAFYLQHLIWTGRSYVLAQIQAITTPCGQRSCPNDVDVQLLAFDTAMNVTATSPSVVKMLATSGFIGMVDLASSGSEVLTAWTQATYPGLVPEVRIQRANPLTLRPEGAGEILGKNAGSIATTWDGARYVLVWIDFSTLTNSTRLIVKPLDGGAPSEIFLASGNRFTPFATSGAEGRAIVAYTRHTVPNPQAHSGTLERAFFRFTNLPHRRIVQGGKR